MIQTFIKKFTEKKVEYDKLGNEYFLIPENLKQIDIGLKPVAKGILLAREEKGKFLPGLPLLDILAEDSDEKVFVNDIGELDFLYGKNLKKRHITRTEGSVKPGFMKLVMNKRGECIGLGKIMKDLGEQGNVLKNILDKGDYLRREKD